MSIAINETTDYSKFVFSDLNRPLDLTDPPTKRLAISMLQSGWLNGYPAMVTKIPGGRLQVEEGQHRIRIAKEYGISIKYVIENKDFDLAVINSTSKPWSNEDFANRYAKGGNPHYAELLEFYNQHNIPFTMCAAMLANTASFGNCRGFKSGDYKIKSREAANAVAETYRKLTMLSKHLKKNSSIKALWACNHVPYFDGERLVSGAEKASYSIKSMPNIERYLELFEELYNHRRHNKYPLAFDAAEAMKDRKAVRPQASGAA